MKTSKRKRSAKARTVEEAVGAGVVVAETPVAAEAGAELSAAAVEALVADPVIAEASGEQVAKEVAESVVDASVEQVAAAIFEQGSDVSNAPAAEVVAEAAVEQVAEIAAEPVIESLETAVGEAAEPVVAGEPIVVLAANCSVKDAAALKSSLCAWSNHGDAVTLDVSAVERVDTATMQLLCAFVRDRSGRKQSVAWRGESAALQDAVRLLGVGALLGLEPTGVAA